MWQSHQETLDKGRIIKFYLLANERKMTYKEVIERWQEETFSTFFSSLLANVPFSAFFWETPPVSEATINQEFEFVLIDSPQLAKVQPDENAFREYFKNNKMIVSFPNLNQDALLIVPCPQAPITAYPHLANFVRFAPETQKHALWQNVALTLLKQLQKKPLWLSTSGLGVYWLHIRLDSFPKYYNFKLYRE